MAKTRRLIEENRKLVDVVIELLDARLVLSSQNPEIDELIGNKPKVVVINKSDLADERVTAEWVEYFKARGRTAVAVDSISGKGMNRVFDAVDEMMREKRKRFPGKGNAEPDDQADGGRGAECGKIFVYQPYCKALYCKSWGQAGRDARQTMGESTRGL